MKEPESMDECFYFTNRILENDGTIVAWCFKPECPECKKVKLGKPVDKKTGKVKIRAKEYECPGCGFTIPKEEMDPTLELNVQYKCPHCGNEDECTTPFKRKKFKGVDAYVFECSKCGEKIGVTKKMKKPKPKKK